MNSDEARELLIDYINGSSAAVLEGPDASLVEGDEVLFLLPVAGG